MQYYESTFTKRKKRLRSRRGAVDSQKRLRTTKVVRLFRASTRLAASSGHPLIDPISIGCSRPRSAARLLPSPPCPLRNPLRSRSPCPPVPGRPPQRPVSRVSRSRPLCPRPYSGAVRKPTPLLRRAAGSRRRADGCAGIAARAASRRGRSHLPDPAWTGVPLG